jgi:diadenosine tetraphosphate (Ap4A) HIT family hydrolase
VLYGKSWQENMNCDCYFCDGLFQLNRRIGLASEESVIYQDDNIFITPDIAPVVEGHFLIVSKVHLNSFANADENAYASLELAKDFLRNSVFKDTKPLFFEHGAVRKNTAGACIDHAHIHVIPIFSDIDIDGFISMFTSSEKKEANKHSILHCAKDNQPYIFYEIEKNNSWLYPVEMLPHQFFRMMVSYRFSINKHYRWGEQYETDKSKKLFENTLNLGRRG